LGDDVAKFDTQKIREQSPINEVAAQAGVSLKKDGREWKACCPFHKEKTASFTIFTGKDRVQRFYCHGCGSHGDVIEFVMEFYGANFEGACEILGGKREAPTTRRELGPPTEIDDPYADYRVKRPPPGQSIDGKVKALNPKRLDHRGLPRVVAYEPSAVYPYTDKDGNLLGYVLRVEIGNGVKITPTILWVKNSKTGFEGWSHGKFPEPRPPYRVAELYLHPEKQVLIVEGEKCADRAAEALPAMIPISWLGGSKAAHRTNWKHLQNRRLVLWPDNDPEGEVAMLGGYDRQGRWTPGIADYALQAGALAIKVVVRPGDDKPKGWDIADALDGKIDVLAFAKAHIIEWTAEHTAKRKRDLAPAPEPAEDEPKAVAPYKNGTHAKPEPKSLINVEASLIPSPPLDLDWRDNLQKTDEGKMKPKSTINFKWLLKGHDLIRGVFAYDEMARNIFVVRCPPWETDDGKPYKRRPLTDIDITETVGFLERLHTAPREDQVKKAINIVSREFAYHPVRHFLKSIEWDGIPRLRGGNGREPFVVDYLGHKPGGRLTWAYAAFFTRWMIAAVARTFDPGCKADAMIVLEGEQGAQKSTMLTVLSQVYGEAYFVDNIRDIDSKDAAQQMWGRWIVEIPELSSFQYKGMEAIKAWLSRRDDRMRPPYGHTVESFPRQSVVAGTMNPSGNGYLRDATGARRFWPIPVKVDFIDLARLREEQPQLWAEAYHLYSKGEQWWLTEKEVVAAVEITGERYEEDPWSYVIEDMVATGGEITVDRIIKTLGISSSQQNSLTVKRITDQLHHNGYIKKRARSALFGKQKTVWVKPATSALDGDGDERI
jgi:predicted P-loop ATPase